LIAGVGGIIVRLTLALGILSPLLGSDCFADDSALVVLTETDAQTTKNIAVGTLVEVRLGARLGTGYSWTLQTPVTLGFQLIGAPRISGATLPGGMQEQVFTFRASAPGRYPISFTYRQPWTAPGVPAKTLGFVVAVGATD
jgi:predicted secreted protein